MDYNDKVSIVEHEQPPSYNDAIGPNFTEASAPPASQDTSQNYQEPHQPYPEKYQQLEATYHEKPQPSFNQTLPHAPPPPSAQNNITSSFSQYNSYSNYDQPISNIQSQPTSNQVIPGQPYMSAPVTAQTYKSPPRTFQYNMSPPIIDQPYTNQAVIPPPQPSKWPSPGRGVYNPQIIPSQEIYQPQTVPGQQIYVIKSDTQAQNDIQDLERQVAQLRSRERQRYEVEKKERDEENCWAAFEAGCLVCQVCCALCACMAEMKN